MTTVAPPAEPAAPLGPARTRRWAGPVAGLAAGVVTVGVASVVALATGATTDPLVAVGAAFVDATPAWLKDAAVDAFGTADKLALGVGEVLVLACLAVLAGVLAVRRWAWGAALVVLLGVVAMAAALGRPDAGWTAAVPSFVGTVAGLWTLRTLCRRARDDQRPDPDGRRGFLRAALVATGLGVVGIGLGRLGSAAGRAAAAVREQLTLPRPVRAAPAPTAGVDLGVEGAEPWVTPADDFYRIDTALVVPQVDPASWRLRVHGLVEQEVELTWDELLASDLVEAWVTLCCVSNPVGGDLVGNQRWLGLPVRDVLARARPTADADMVLSRSADGWTASTPLGALTDDRDALLAIGMDGEPLPAQHGFPVRMVVPGLYGYVSATKWVTELEVTRFDRATAYWTERGWAPLGPVKTQSRIEVPASGARLAAGQVVVAGTAWAQHRGVTRVQVQVDDGPWAEATLADEAGIDSWRQWRYAWEATPGEHRLRVRAADPEGTQTGAVADVVPDGATGYHEIRCEIA
ncbi:molybdopterin-dependent oxidoreductase [Cellulomonas sp.]|uniref:molybdopterin-dependent oxidoreductase n=1 Tax=Cellulomonas sp. TaxID=40001 RepID=UPI00259026CA|nr:molybdopterin-dependent oxidoreductase [Cellulomonas sp.]MCR6690593.1 molybdopterin-dependent oxidoreductase [Cellulomonas sp.]